MSKVLVCANAAVEKSSNNNAGNRMVAIDFEGRKVRPAAVPGMCLRGNQRQIATSRALSGLVFKKISH